MLVSLIAIKVKTDTGWFKLPTLKGSPGFSAYEVWINEGNIGTITDYLNSLKGADGAPGIQGPQGQTGPQGLPGNLFQFIYTNTTENVAPTTPATSQSDTAPTGWSIYPIGISEVNKYQWVSTRIKTNGIWGNYATPTLWAIYSTGGDSSPYILPQATNLILGGIKATARTTEATPVVIDTSTGFLYTSASGSGGVIEDVALNVENPKLYGRYSGDQSWREISPEQGSVGTLQQVTTNGATSDKLIILSGGLKLSTLLQLPDTDPTELLDAGKYGLYVSDTGISGELPTSGEGGDYILPKASTTVLGGIKVGSNLSINSEGVLSAIGTEGGIEDVSLDTVTPKLYGRYSGDQSWQEILLPEVSVDTLQQVTASGASTNILVNLTGGAKVKTILQVPNTVPQEVDEGFSAIFINDEVGNATIAPPDGGDSGGTYIHNELSGRDSTNSHPTSAITGLDTALQNLASSIGNISDALYSKLDDSHASDSNAHKSIFDTKASLNGDSTENFSVKNLTATETVTMLENVNTNLRIPQAAPTNPVAGQTYLYIE